MYARTMRRPALAGAVLLITLGGAMATPKGPKGGPPQDGLTRQDIQRILRQGEAAANQTISGVRATINPADGTSTQLPTKMHIAVVARDGKFLDIRSMPDAWVGSIDIAIAKARTGAFFSSNENALTSRVVGQFSQPDGPLWGIGNSNQIGISGGPEFRNGIITFPGGIPLYKNGKLVGGVGVSGDGVDQDEAVAFAAAAGFEPGPTIPRLGWPTP